MIVKKQISFLICGFLLFGCKTEIKNTKAKVEVEEGAKVEESVKTEYSKSFTDPEIRKEPKSAEKKLQINKTLLGFWVGDFDKDDRDYTKNVYADEYSWNRENKINISIDKIEDTIVSGHSVVAGNNRPFKGIVKKNNETYSFLVKEPGDHKYDGEFSFTISNKILTGKWTAYGDIEIKNRKFSLEKKVFVYDPDIMLERSRRYVNWNKFKEKKEKVEMEENVFEEWISKEFSSATHLIYEINASNTLLTKSQVENLKRGDLTIIRNTIYARHGYSFKNRPLRVFFDAQSWYIPVHSNIKEGFTELEKKNIKLLLRYEKNAKEYYDYFGRG